MPLSGGGNKWTDHVREFARKRNISYMCAMSDPECSQEYRYKKGKDKSPKKPRGKKAAVKESEASLGDIYPEVEMSSTTTPEDVRSKLKQSVDRRKQGEREATERQKMGAEDIISAALKRASAPVSAVPQAKTKAGRPRKYASAEEAKKAKSQKTVAAAKKRREAKRALRPPPKTAEQKREEKLIKLSDELEPLLKSAEGKVKDKYNSDVKEVEDSLVKGEMSKIIGKMTRLAWGEKDEMYNKYVGPQLGRVVKLEEKMDALEAKAKAGKGRTATAKMSYLRPANADFGDTLGKTRATKQKSFSRPQDADFGDPLSGGRRRRGISGFFNSIADAARVVNPMTYLISNKKTSKAMSDLGKVTNNTLLPAVVTVGKPLYDAAAATGSTLATGNPLLGKVAADALWNKMAAPNDPRKRHPLPPAVKQLAEFTGNTLAKSGQAASGSGWNPFDWGYHVGHDILGPALLGKGYESDLEGGRFNLLGAIKSIGHAIGKPFEVITDHPEALVGLGYGVHHGTGGMVNPFAERPGIVHNWGPDYIPGRKRNITLLGADPRTWTPQADVHPEASALVGMGYGMGYEAGASTIQKGLAAEMRTYLPYKLRGVMNNITHSGDRNPEPENQFIDDLHRPDEFAEDWIEVAQKYLNAEKKQRQTGQRMPYFQFPPEDRADWEALKSGKKPPAKKAPPARQPAKQSQPPAKPAAPSFVDADFPALGK